jgi:hypothetical protein
LVAAVTDAESLPPGYCHEEDWALWLYATD